MAYISNTVCHNFQYDIVQITYVKIHGDLVSLQCICKNIQGVSKVRSDFSSLKFHLLLKIPFIKPGMLLIIHLTLNNWNKSKQNVFLYVIWHFISGEV